MRVYEYAKEHGLSNDEVKSKFGLSSHMSLIPEENTTICTGDSSWTPEDVEESINEGEEDMANKKTENTPHLVEEAKALQIKNADRATDENLIRMIAKKKAEVRAKVEQIDSDDLELIEASIRGNGQKSPYWNMRKKIGRE